MKSFRQLLGRLALAAVGTTIVAPAPAVACGEFDPASILPSGTYHYAVRSEGKTTATSTIVIAHAKSTMTVSETVDLQGETVKTRRVLDPGTFSTQSWSGLNDAMGDSIEIAGKRGTYRSRDKTESSNAAAQGPATVFDFFVGEFEALPAMVIATGALNYNEYCACIGDFQTESVAVLPAPDARRPAGARPEDAAFELKHGNETAMIWFDAQTLIVREVDFPHEKISYVRL